MDLMNEAVWENSYKNLVVWSASSNKPCGQSAVQMTKALLKERYRTTLEDLMAHQLGDDKFYDRFYRLNNTLIELLEIAKLYSFQNMDMNGFCTFVESFVDLLEYICCEKYLTKASAIDDLTDVLKVFDSLANCLKEAHKLRNDQKKSLVSLLKPGEIGLLDDGSENVEAFLQTLESLAEETKTLYEKFYLFWMDKPSKRVLLFLSRGLTLAAAGFWNWPKVLNSTFVARTMRKMSYFASYQAPLKSLSFIDSWIGRTIFSIISYNRQVKSERIYVPSQGTWTIPDNGLDLIENTPVKSVHRTIPCRLLTHASKPNVDNILVIHLHGGALVVTSPEVHEFYTRTFVSELEGAAILCPDYTLKVRYPRQIQQVLDVYLWVTSNDPAVKDLLGFQPEKVILMGDSVGGMLALSLLDIFDRIESKCPEFSIKLPESIVLFYGGFLPHLLNTPSRIAYCYDVMLSTGVVLAIGGILFGIENGEDPSFESEDSNSGLFQQSMEELRSLKSLVSSPITTPWYLKDGSYDEKAIKSLHEKAKSSYLASLTSVNYQKFAQIGLYLVSCSKCTFLDENVDLARLWKGYVELHVLKKKSHGFLFIPGEHEAFQFCLNLLKRVTLDCNGSEKAESG